MEQQHRDNLEKLGRYLAKLSPEYNEKHFRMQYFLKHTQNYEVDSPDPDMISTVRKYLNECLCGTVACALGHVPNALPKEYKRAVESDNTVRTSWWELSEPLFGFGRNTRDERYTWDWLFSGDWDDLADRYDKPYWRTSWAAADRIAFLLGGIFDANEPDPAQMEEAEGACVRAGWISKRMLETRIKSLAPKEDA